MYIHFVRNVHMVIYVHIDVTSVSLINYIDRWKASSENIILALKKLKISLYIIVV